MAQDKETQQQQVERIVETYSTMLLRVAVNQLGNQTEAEDIVQKVFLKLLKTKQEFQSSEHEKAWLLRVTINECKDLLRSSPYKKRAELNEAVELPAEKELPDGESFEILDAIQKLPEKYKSVIYLFYYEGYTTVEIADILQSRKGTVESQLSRAREKLKEELKGGWTG